MNIKRNSGFLLVILCSLFFIHLASAESYNISSINETLSTITVENASNMYSYEVNFDFSGGEGNYSIQQAEFIGDSSVAVYGSILKEGILSVYGSRLDSEGVGVNGTGNLFNVSYTNGNLSLRYSLSITGITGSTTTETYTYYNESDDEGEPTVVIIPVALTSASSGGGGGGGGGLLEPLQNVSLSVFPEELSIDSIAGKSAERIITFRNDGPNALFIELRFEGVQNIISSVPYVNLAPGEQKEVKLEVKSVQKGLLVGKLILRGNGFLIKEIPLVINARSENFLFDSSIIIPDVNKIITAGAKLRAQISLLEVASNEKLDVVANYVIKDFSGRVYLEESETFFVQGSKDYVKEFQTQGLLPGKYILGLEIIYPGAFATSSAQFEINSTRFASSFRWAAVIALIVIACLAAVFLAIRNRRRYPKPKHPKSR